MTICETTVLDGDGIDPSCTEVCDEEKRGCSTARIVAIGGGKGGTGKSWICANLGVQLARRGYRVVLVDADLGGGNLHSLLGVDAPEVTLSDYFSRRVEALSEVVSPTGITRVRLVSGALDGLTAANPKFAQKARLLNQLATLSADYILVDLSAGTSFNVLDFYLIADHRLLVVTPEPTCMENAYRFMKAAFYRHIKYLESHWSFKALLKQILEVSEQRDLQTPLDILQDVGNTHPEAALALKKELGSLSLDIVVNQVRTAQEARVGEVMATACVDYFGMLKPIWTTIPYDDAVWQSVRRRTPLTGFEQDGGAARGLRALVASLVVEEVALCP